jgi:hypothetical protein
MAEATHAIDLSCGLRNFVGFSPQALLVWCIWKKQTTI